MSPQLILFHIRKENYPMLFLVAKLLDNLKCLPIRLQNFDGEIKIDFLGPGSNLNQGFLLQLGILKFYLVCP